MRISLLILALSLIAFACASFDRSANGDVIEARGTVQYVDLEGGFYGIVGDDGQRFDPTNLSDEFKEDGLRVRFRARTRDDLMSIRMWGTLVEIVSIERL